MALHTRDINQCASVMNKYAHENGITGHLDVYLAIILIIQIENKDIYIYSKLFSRNKIKYTERERDKK